MHAKRLMKVTIFCVLLLFIVRLFDDAKMLRGLKM